MTISISYVMREQRKKKKQQRNGMSWVGKIQPQVVIYTKYMSNEHLHAIL